MSSTGEALLRDWRVPFFTFVDTCCPPFSSEEERTVGPGAGGSMSVDLEGHLAFDWESFVGAVGSNSSGKGVFLSFGSLMELVLDNIDAGSSTA